MRTAMMTRFYLLAMVATAIWSVGCEPTKKPAPAADQHAHEEHSHEEHSHAHGPHGGPVFHLGEATFAAEGVVNKANNQVQIFIVEKDHAEHLFPVKAEKILIKTSLAGGKNFELVAVKPDADGKAAEFSLVDAELVTLAASHPEVEIVVEGKTHTGKFDFH